MDPSSQPPILILSRQAKAYLRFVSAGLADVPLLTAESAEEARRIGHAATVVFGDPSLLKQVLDDLPNLAWVQSTWAGVDTLMDKSLRHDYMLTNVRDVFGRAISDYVLAYILMHERRGWQRYTAQQEGRWDPTPPGSTDDKTMGILGVGSIGAVLAHTAKAFGITVLGYTRASQGHPDIQRLFHGSQLADMVAQCDYVVATLPDTPATHHILNADVFAAMRPHALFINVGRGGTVDEQALLDALARGAIGGAILDVFEKEPLPAGHPLWRMPNVLITSHTAALSFPKDIAPIFIENYRRWRNAEPLAYRVNFDLGY